jgi:hypothetical protein
MEKHTMDHEHDHPQVQGWGADLDHANRPAYPKERTPPRLEVPWKQPEQQVPKVKILHSTERPGITPVFGSPQPPSGLSGKIREASFKFSENDIRHWLMLLFADRVNMVEGIGCDLMRGHVPNIFAEMGWKAELQHNRPAFLRKVATISALTALGVYLVRRRRGR